MSNKYLRMAPNAETKESLHPIMTCLVGGIDTGIMHISNHGSRVGVSSNPKDLIG